ncbi:MAG TPA: sugar nucleotide-binding protein, partial [Rhodanobacteraceae bacterium]|nr:sugar nucleotide-binding protein [Rhodanobacteraceae bacterium]
ERDELRIVDDQRGAPTAAGTIASATAQALSLWLAWDGRARDAANGTYHLCAGGQCSWFEFAQAIVASAKRAGLVDRVPAVVPIATADYPTRARRPAWSVLDTTKIRAAFGLNLPRWEQGLDAVIGELAEARRRDSP